MPPLQTLIGHATYGLRAAGKTGTVLIMMQAAPAANVGLKWNPNPEPEIVRYEVSCRSVSGNQVRIIDAGTATRLTVTGLDAGTAYGFSVTAVDASGVRSEPSDAIIYQTPACGDPTAPIARDRWSSPSADSEETTGHAAALAFDGDPSTFWHTAWRSGTTPPPHDICLDLGAPHVLGGFRYLPRQDGFTVGNIGSYGFFVSMDGVEWHAPAAVGTFAATRDQKQVLFTPIYGRFIKLVQYSEVNGHMDCNAAELVPLGFAATGDVPQARAMQSGTSRDTPVAVQLDAGRSSSGPLEFNICRLPLHGTLSGTPPQVVYTPAPGFTGCDSFAFQASDGIAASSEAVVAVTVAGVPDFASWMENHGTSGGITGDADGDGIPNGVEFLIGTDPSRGSGMNGSPSFATAETDPEQWVFTYRRSDAADADPTIQIQVQWTADPSSAWTNAADTPGIESETVNDGVAPGIDEVKVRIPRSLTRTGSMFARVAVSAAAP